MSTKPQPTYWNSEGRYQATADALRALIPDHGPITDAADNPALEKFRQASNYYYDLYNNGLCNRAKEFREAFGFSGMGIVKSRFTDGELIARLDAAMDLIVKESAAEQGVRLSRAKAKARKRT